MAVAECVAGVAQLHVHVVVRRDEQRHVHVPAVTGRSTHTSFLCFEWFCAGVRVLVDFRLAVGIARTSASRCSTAGRGARVRSCCCCWRAVLPYGPLPSIQRLCSLADENSMSECGATGGKKSAPSQYTSLPLSTSSALTCTAALGS